MVRPSSVIAKYQTMQMDPRDIGQELRVSAVLTAGFIHAGGRFRVTAQLLDVGSGDILWSDRIDTSTEDIIAVQDEIAQRIVEGLCLELSPAEQDGIAKPSTQNAAAYEAISARAAISSRVSFSALSLRKTATPPSNISNARSSSIRISRWRSTVWALLTSIEFSKALAAPRITNGRGRLSIGPWPSIQKLIEARMLMVFVYLWRGQKQKAREEVFRARKEAPDEPVVHFVKATLHRLDGEYGRALRSYDRLMRLDPAAHVVASSNRALVYMYMGNFEEVSPAVRPRPAIRTTHWSKLFARVVAVLHRPYQDAAAELMKGNVAEHPKLHGIRPFMAMFLSAQGKRDEALAQTKQRRHQKCRSRSGHCLLRRLGVRRRRNAGGSLPVVGARHCSGQ